MKLHFNFFDDAQYDDRVSAPGLLDGFRYQRELIKTADEEALLTRVRQLPFKEFDFHGYKGKRRTVSFGWQYEFAGAGRLHKADDIPEFLLPLRTVAASFARVAADAFEHVLVIEYGPGSGIGWHRDKPVFGQVVGVSLLAPCVIRFRREKDVSRRGSSETKHKRVKTKWERVNVLTEPRSAYHLNGPARSEWQHSILRVDSLRYSITFREVLER